AEDMVTGSPGEVHNGLGQHGAEVPLAEDDDVIQAFPSDATCLATRPRDPARAHRTARADHFVLTVRHDQTIDGGLVLSVVTRDKHRRKGSFQYFLLLSSPDGMSHQGLIAACPCLFLPASLDDAAVENGCPV